MKSVRLPPGLETIGIAAVQDCVVLERVELPASLVHIEDQAFEGYGSLKTLVVRAVVPPGLGLGRYSPPIPVGEDPRVFTRIFSSSCLRERKPRIRLPRGGAFIAPESGG